MSPNWIMSSTITGLTEIKKSGKGKKIGLVIWLNMVNCGIERKENRQ